MKEQTHPFYLVRQRKPHAPLLVAAVVMTMMVVRWCYDDDDDGGVGVVVVARGCGDRMPPPNPNNTYIQPPSEIQILKFIKTLGYDEDPETKLIVGIVHSANLDFASLIWDKFKWQTVERSSRPSKMSKLLYTRFTKLIIDYLLSLNKSIPRRSDSKLHSSQDDHPINKLLNTTNGDYKFGMEVPDAMISDAIKKKAGYKYYMAKKVESEKAKIVDKPEEQHVSLVKSGRGKGFMCYADQVLNVPNKLKKDVVSRKTRSLTIAEEAVVDMYNEWGQKLKVPAVEDPVIQSLLDLWKGSKASRLASLRQKSNNSEKSEESANETDDADEPDMDLFDDNAHGDDDAARYGVFMPNKSTTTPNPTYLSLTVTSSLLDFIQTLLDESPANELTDFMSHPMYSDAQTTTVVHNLEGNPELTSYISGAFKVPLGTHVDAKKNMRNFNFKKEVAHKFKEYDQKVEALTNFNVFKAFEIVVQTKVLTEIKKLLPTHIPNAIVNYVKPRLNTSMLEVMKTNQINLFTQSSTTTDDLSEMDLKLKLLNRIYLNKSNDTHTTHQQLYDTLYESINLDQDALDAQAAQSSFYKRSHDNQDPLNNHEGENKKKRRKDVGEPSSRSSTRNRSPMVIVYDDTPAMQPLDQADILIQKHSKPEWFPKKSAKKFKELIQKDELLIADFEGVGLERLKVQYNNDVELEYHVSKLKAAVLSEAQWNSDEGEKKYTTSITKHYAAIYYKYGIEDKILERWRKEVRRYHFEALNGIHHWKEDKIDLFKAGMSVITERNVFSDLRIKSVVHIVVKKKLGYGFLT
ncbi:hypothetical protein Tco_0603649 [Tanacetum coccineum]